MPGRKNLFWNFSRSKEPEFSESTHETLYLVSDLDVASPENKAEDIFTPHYLEVTSNSMSEKINWAFWKSNGEMTCLKNEFEKAKTVLSHEVSTAVIYKLRVPRKIINPKFLEKKEGPVILPQGKTKKTESSKITIEAVFFSPCATFIDLETFALKEDSKKEDSEMVLSYKRF